MNGLYAIFVFLVGIGAGFVQRVSGFGLGIFSMIFFPHFLPVQAGPVICSIHSCTISSFNAVRYRKYVHYRTALPMMVAALLTVPLTVRFAKDVSADRLHDVLNEFRSVGFDAFPFLCGSNTFVGDVFTAELILNDTRLHIGEKAT